MTVQTSIHPKPVPVILACDPLPAIWPHSTRQAPYVFRSSADKSAPALQLALAFAAREEFAEAILLAPESASVHVMRQVIEIMPQLRVVFVPDHVKPVMASLLAAMIANGREKDAPLVLVPANIVARDLNQLAESALKMVSFLSSTGQAVTLARMLRDVSTLQDGDMLLQINGRNAATNLQTGRVLPGKVDPTHVENLMEMKFLARGLGLFAVSSTILLEAAARHFPNALEACRLALAASTTDSGFSRSIGGLLRLSTSVPVHQLVDKAGAAILLFPADEGVELVQSLCDLPPESRVSADNPTTRGLPVVVEGFPDHRLYSSADGTLIVPAGMEHLAANHFDRHDARTHGNAHRGAAQPDEPAKLSA